MVIAKLSVTDFLARDLADSSIAKSFTEEALDAKLAMLQPAPFFHTAPHKHQKVAFLLAEFYKSYLLFLDPGLGKTKISLDVFVQHQRANRAKRLLVAVPNISVVDSWEEQTKLHAPQLHAIGLSSNTELTAKEKEDAFFEEGDVVIVTYAGLLRYACDKEPLDDSEDSANKLVPSEKRIKQIAAAFQMLVLDETSKLRKHTSTLYKAIKKMSKLIPYRLGLTGTPFDKNVEDLWSQFFLIDHGATLGETLGLFRAAFFEETRSYWGGFPEHKFDKKKTELLTRVLHNRSLRYTQEECLDLPPIVYNRREVVLPETTKTYYNLMVDAIKEAKGDIRLIDNAYVRLRQLTAGYVSFVDGSAESGRRETIFGVNPKLDALEGLLEELPPDRKLIIFNEYVKTGEIICAFLKKKKVKHTRLWGGSTDHQGVIEEFKHNAGTRVLVANSQSGGIGVNLQCANYIVFYESPPDTISRKQAIARCLRMGQQHHVFCYDLVVKNSIDAKILTALQAGIVFHDLLIDGKGSVDRL